MAVGGHEAGQSAVSSEVGAPKRVRPESSRYSAQVAPATAAILESAARKDVQLDSALVAQIERPDLNLGGRGESPPSVRHCWGPKATEPISSSAAFFNAELAQLIERLASTQKVAGLNPASRSTFRGLS